MKTWTVFRRGTWVAPTAFLEDVALYGDQHLLEQSLKREAIIPL